MEETRSKLVSVILPTHNDGKYIYESIESILCQSYTNLELIVIDDGSTDNTLEIVRSFQDNRMKVITNFSCLGIVDSLNKGIEIATGDLIARMDGDDISFPNRLEKEVQFLNANPNIDIVGTWVRMIDHGGSLLDRVWTPEPEHEQLLANCLFGCPMCHPTVMLRAKVFDNFLYDNRFSVSEDFDLWTKVLEKYKAATIQEFLLYYRKHSENTQTKSSTLQKRQTRVIIERELRKYGLILEQLELNSYVDYFFNYENKYDLTDLIHIKKWLSKLSAANESTKRIESRYFDKILVRKEFFFCMRYKRHRNLSVFLYLILPVNIKWTGYRLKEIVRTVLWYTKLKNKIKTTVLKNLYS